MVYEIQEVNRLLTSEGVLSKSALCWRQKEKEEMKKFKEFLTNEYFKVLKEEDEQNKGSYIPAPNAKVGSKYPDTPEGWSQWKDDTKTNAAKLKKQSEEETENTSHTSENLEKAETGLKAIKSGADAALSVGSIIAPGPGTALNAVVKGGEAALDLSQGNKISAAMNVADAALPYAGKLAKAAKTAAEVPPVATKLATGIEKAVSAAKTGFMTAVNPIGVGLETAAKKTGVSKIVSKGIETGTEAAAKAVQKLAPQTAKALNVATEEGAKAVANSAGELGSESGIRIATDYAGERALEKIGRTVKSVNDSGLFASAKENNRPNSVYDTAAVSKEPLPRINKAKV